VQVTAVGGVDVFVYLVYHDAEGDSFLMFPNPKHRRNFVAAGKTCEVLGGSGFGFRIRGPFGKEQLRVIASPHPLLELEQLFEEGQPADVLNEWLKASEAQPEIDTQFSDFETRPAGGEHLQSGPQRVE
jgi:hypothetical protein